MVCPRCNQPVEKGALFCGNCGNQIVPVQARGATVADATELITPPDNRQYSLADPQQFAASIPGYQPPIGQRFDSLSPLAQRETVSSLPPTQVPPPSVTPPSGGPGNSGRRRFAFIAIIIALLIIGLSAGLFTLVQQKHPAPSTTVTSTTATGTPGTISFSSSAGNQGITDTVSIDITGLSAPSQGTQYDAWLENQQEEKITPLGQLNPQGKDFVVTHTVKGQNLLALGNMILITQEKSGTSLPTNAGILSAQFPPLAFIHIKHVLVAFPSTPHNVGLLVGLLGQAQQVDAQALLLKNASDNGNTTAVTCAAQNLLNLVEGQHGQHFNQLPAWCAALNITVNGDGFGLLGQNGYVSLAAQHASLAAQASDATDTVKTNAGHLETSMSNVKNRMTTIDQDALSLLSNPGDKGKVQEIVTSANYAVNGFDLSSNGDVNPSSGQAGVVLAVKQAQLMAQLTLQKV
jgi:FlaG/FlaF family flagellin (archaellin)